MGNNPLIYVDPSGHDAIVLTNPDLAMGFGHNNNKGEWSYFYYGDYSVEFSKVDSNALKDLKNLKSWGKKIDFLDLVETDINSLLIYREILTNPILLQQIW